MGCSICGNPQVAAIDAAVARGDALRQIGAAYGVDKSTLARHKHTCLSAVSVARQANPTARRLEQYHGEAQQLYAALTSGPPWDARQALAAMANLLVKMTAP